MASTLPGPADSSPLSSPCLLPRLPPQVVKEILRYRAPAPMVPQLAYCDYPLSEEYAIPKGTLVFPSINAANMQVRCDARCKGKPLASRCSKSCATWHAPTLPSLPSLPACPLQGFPEPTKFDPDRMGPERKEDIVYAKNFLTFGYGPHYCVGECRRQAGLSRQQTWPVWRARAHVDTRLCSSLRTPHATTIRGINSLCCCMPPPRCRQGVRHQPAGALPLHRLPGVRVGAQAHAAVG